MVGDDSGDGEGTDAVELGHIAAKGQGLHSLAKGLDGLRSGRLRRRVTRGRADNETPNSEAVDRTIERGLILLLLVIEVDFTVQWRSLCGVFGFERVRCFDHWELVVTCLGHLLLRVLPSSSYHRPTLRQPQARPAPASSESPTTCSEASSPEATSAPKPPPNPPSVAVFEAGTGSA